MENVQQIRTEPTRLEDFEPNIEHLLESVFIGPQAEVLEDITLFNDRYVGSGWQQTHTKKLAITKKFYWRPGAYDTIKDIICHLQELPKKAASLTKVVERVRYNSPHRIRNLWDTINGVENKLFSLRRRGIVFQDNTSDLIEYWNVIKNKLLQQQEMCNNITGLSDHIIFETTPYIVSNNLLDYYIDVIYTYDDVKISYKDVGCPDEIAQINCPGTVMFRVRLRLSRWMNLLSIVGNLENIPWSSHYETSRQRKNPYTIGGAYINEYSLEHPYISRSGSNNWSPDGVFNSDFKYVCVGNLATEISQCIKSLDFVSLKVFIDRLATHYDTQTGPLNNIKLSYYGQPNFLHNAYGYYERVGKTDSADCRYRNTLEMKHIDGGVDLVKEESYCVKYCSIKSECNMYQRCSKEQKPLSREDIEKEMIETITINAARRIQ